MTHRPPPSRLLTAALVLVAAAGLAGAGCASNAEPSGAEAPPTPVEVAEVTLEARSLPIRTSGRLASKSELKLAFKTGGVVSRILVDEGARVQAGQLLARLDLSEIEAQVAQARSGFEKAARDLERTEALYADSVATLEQLQNARTGVETAEAGLEIAAFNRRYSEIRAPSSGRVLRRLAEPGELISPGAPVFVFGATESGWVVRTGVADRDVVRLSPGDPARLAFDAFPGETFTGRITELAEAADPMSGTFEVEVTVDDPGARLRSGFIARVDLIPSARDMLAFVPIEALVEGDGSRGVVYALSPDGARAERRTVEIAHLLDDTLALRAGLAPGETVVTRGASYLTDSARVRVIDPQRP